MMKIYTDGSCLNNPGPGGWGVIGLNGSDEVQFKLGGGDTQTTNNIMELTAVIQGIKRCGVGPVKVYTDSKYVMDGITKWIKGWKRNGWKTATGAQVKNQELWKTLDDTMNSFVTFEWVKGHSGDIWNEEVDKLANQIAYLFKSSSPL